MNNKTEQIRVAVDSLGCKLNQAEMEHLAFQLGQAGYRLVDTAAEADIYILNSCTVTHIADRKSRHMMRLARRRNPRVRLVAVGCYAERAPRELECIDGVELVVSNDRKFNLVEILEALTGLPKPVVEDSTPLYENNRRTRSFIKVQDGCQNFCTYCIVPLVRSREESVPFDHVLKQVSEKVAAGYKEVVLTGTEIGTYRYNGTNLKSLLKLILEETDILRLRLSSLQPPEITPELVTLWDNPRLCPHFHVSLQSGSDTVLSCMKRRYNTADYRQVVSMIRESVPDVAITTDVIIGFPGETEAEFQESLNFSREMKFARIHVFPYSPRPGTAAAEIPQKISAQIKKQRTRQMLALAEESAQCFHQSFLNRTMDVLWEQRSGGIWSGLTGNYIKVYTKHGKDLANSLTPVKLENIYRDGLWGNIS